MTLDPVTLDYIGHLFLVWFVGFGMGIVARAVRQFFEKAAS